VGQTDEILNRICFNHRKLLNKIFNSKWFLTTLSLIIEAQQQCYRMKNFICLFTDKYVNRNYYSNRFDNLVESNFKKIKSIWID
jgi:hypothetical protein